MQKNIDEQIHQEKLKYYQNWRDNNKDKIKQHTKNFWLKKIKEEEKNV